MRAFKGTDALQSDAANKRLEQSADAPVEGASKIGVLWILEYLAWLLVTFFLAGIFALAVLSPVIAKTDATARGSNEKGFGRIVINFSDLPKFKHEMAAGIFVITFDDEVIVDLELVKEAIPKYVGLVRRDPDGKALRFALNRPYQINLMEAGKELFIDLLPPEWQGHPPPLPVSTVKALTMKALEAEREKAEKEAQRKSALVPYELNVRLGRHPTFTRIVFDWNKFVAANLTRNGGWVELRFDQLAKANFAELRSDVPKFLKTIDSVPDDEGMVVQLSIDEDVDVRGFREGMSYVVDLTGPDALADDSANEVANALGAKRPPDTTSLNALTPKGRSEMALLSGKRKDKPAGAKERGADVTMVTKDIDPAVLSEQSFSGIKANPPEFAGKVDTPGKTIPEPKIKLAKKATEKAPDVIPDPVTMPVAQPRGSGAPDTTSQVGVIRHTFQFEKPTSAAFFRRGRSIWAVFDSSQKLNVDALREAAGRLVNDIKVIPFGEAQYVRIKLATAQLIHVSHSGNGWHISIGDTATGETNILRLVRTLREDKRSLIKVEMKGLGKVHWITDPEVGDRIAVVTAFAPDRSINKPQEFVDFTAFATAHGIAIRPRTDDVAVRLHLDEVLITRREGLTLSAGNAGQYDAGRKPLRKAAQVGFIDFNKWTIKEPEELSDKISDLQRRIASAAQDRMNVIRFDLATLYTANDFYAESIGLLRRMENVDEDVVLDPAYNALRGATLVLMNRLAEARKDFEVHALANDADASLWRSMIAVKEQNWEQALERFSEGADRLSAYRADIHARFRLGAIRAALEVGQLTRAAQQLNALPGSALPNVITAEYDVLRGRYLDSVGRGEESAEAFRVALDSGVQPVVAEARLYSSVLDLKSGKTNRTDTLKALEQLQLFWRGDDIELRTLRVLADLYAQEQRFRDAFTVMRNSIDAFPKDPLAMRIQDDMREVFKDLFLHGKGDKMEPVKALSLYYGYRELTPVGRLGDEMIRRLADRLVQVDLLDQAGELLDHQVTKRLNGAARAQVATRLALVHLMNHKADAALRVLRQTRQAGLPSDLQGSRNLLEARALGELGRAAAAVEILNTMEGDSVERLKADAYWSGQEWKNAGGQIEKMLGNRWSEPDELTKTERFYVLRAAIAFSLAEDQFSLNRLRKKYYPKLVKTSDAGSFLIVTKPIKEKDVTFRNLAKEIAAIDTLDTFIKEFKSGYGKRGPGKQAAGDKPAANTAG